MIALPASKPAKVKSYGYEVTMETVTLSPEEPKIRGRAAGSLNATNMDEALQNLVNLSLVEAFPMAGLHIAIEVSLAILSRSFERFFPGAVAGLSMDLRVG